MDIIETIKKAEGFRSKPYRDHLGNLTIGYGFNLDAGIDEEFAEYILKWKIEDVQFQVDSLCAKNKAMILLRDARLSVLDEMCYQLGKDGLSKFTKMWEALSDGNFKSAADEIRKSKLYQQCPKRAERYARQMETGEYQEDKYPYINERRESESFKFENSIEDIYGTPAYSDSAEDVYARQEATERALSGINNRCKKGGDVKCLSRRDARNNRGRYGRQ